MKWRLREGNGEAIYNIGVEDNGVMTGLSEEDMSSSLDTLQEMARRLGATLQVSNFLSILSTYTSFHPIYLSISSILCGHLSIFLFYPSINELNNLTFYISVTYAITMRVIICLFLLGKCIHDNLITLIISTQGDLE